MEERGNKTIMSSVLFLDIVGYSKKSVSAQISTKEVFNSMLANAIQDVPDNDRVILDTGDGAAVTFLGDVEDALKAVLAFRASLFDEGTRMDPPIEVCMGINLGPVRLVKDINGRPNIVGDGINVAQRIMGFAKPGQILVSRSYFDAASRLSQEYAGMFYSEGTRADKHDREHEIYAIGQPDEATVAQQQVGVDTLGRAVKHGTVEVVEGRMQNALALFQNASGEQRALYAGIVASALALLIVVTVKIVHRPEAPAPQVTTEAQIAASAIPAASTVVAEPPTTTEETVVEPDVKDVAAMAAAEEPKKAESAAAKKPKTPRKTVMPAAQIKDSKQAPQAAAKESVEAKPAATASVGIAVTPWGEIYLDGKKQGVSPPLDELKVTPGNHDIEIRNTTFPPYIVSIQVKADEQMKIKHKF